MRAGCSRVTHPCAGRRHKYCYPRAAPRLACVRPAASVHPEPGSNSSLYISCFSKLNPRTLSSILGLRFLLRNQRSRICFRYFACTAYSSLVNELPMSVRNRSDASFPLAPGPLWCPSFRTGLQRYCFFPNLQIFLDFFLTFFHAEGRRGTLRTGPGTAQRAGRQRNHGERGGDRKMMHRTTHLTHFPANTVAGGTFNASPGTIFPQYHAWWEGNDTSD